MTDPVSETNHIEITEEPVTHVEEIKRPRGRPKKEKPPQDLTQPKIRGRPRVKPPQDLTEPKVRGRPRKNPPIVRKEGRGRPRIYEIGTITKPVDPDYFKKYYENVVKVKRNARRLVPLE